MRKQNGFSVVLLVVAGLVLAALAIAFLFVSRGDNNNNTQTINSFDECVAAGNPVAESYPEQCHADGKSFSNPRQTAPPAPETQ